jgi:arsenate reductase (thioredoxin)
MAALSHRAVNVLFLSNEGAIRAPIAAAVLNAGRGVRFQAFWAGIRPAASIPAQTRDALKVAGIPFAGASISPLSAFQAPESRPMDFVFDMTEPYESAGPIVLPGAPPVVAWPIPRPVVDSGTQAERGARMAETIRMIRRRVELFAELPMDKLDSLALRLQAERIHRQVGA